MAPKSRTAPQGRQSTLLFKNRVAKPIRGKKLVGDNSYTPPEPRAVEPITRGGGKEDGKVKEDKELEGRLEEEEKLKGKVEEEEREEKKKKEEEREEEEEEEEGQPGEVAARKTASNEIRKYYRSSILESRLSPPCMLPCLLIRTPLETDHRNNSAPERPDARRKGSSAL